MDLKVKGLPEMYTLIYFCDGSKLYLYGFTTALSASPKIVNSSILKLSQFTKIRTVKGLGVRVHPGQEGVISFVTNLSSSHLWTSLSSDTLSRM